MSAEPSGASPKRVIADLIRERRIDALDGDTDERHCEPTKLKGRRFPRHSPSEEQGEKPI